MKRGRQSQYCLLWDQDQEVGASEFAVLDVLLGSFPPEGDLSEALQMGRLVLSTYFSSRAGETSFAIHFGSWEIPSLFTPSVLLKKPFILVQSSLKTSKFKL